MSTFQTLIRESLAVLCVTLLSNCAISESQEADNPVAADDKSLYVASTEIWGSRSIPVCWENSSASNAIERGWVQNAAATSWPLWANVAFSGWGQCTGTSRGVRILLDDSGPHTKGLGKQLDGLSDGMVLNFTFANWSQSCQTQREFCIRAIAVHEFGHSLGFAHEQNRPDTPSSCTEPPQGSNGDMTIGAWDLQSIMNYCNPNWNGNGNLSATDIIGVNQVYGGGAYWKWYGDTGTPSADFSAYQPMRLADASTVVIRADLNGDKRTDILFFQPETGAFRKCYGDSATPSPDLNSCQPWRFIGGTPGLVTGAQMIPVDFNGDGKQDILVFRPSDGTFWKWYSDATIGPDFNFYGAVRYIGGAAGKVANAQAIPVDFNGDGKEDIAVFRPSDGTYWKWYSDATIGSDFSYYGSPRFIGGSSGTVANAQMIPADFNGDGKKDILVFRPSDGIFWKWYSDATVGSDFSYYGSPRFIGGSPGMAVNAQMIPADFNGDGKQDNLVFRPSDGTYWKWFSDGTISSDFSYYGAARFIGGVPRKIPNAQMIPADFNGDGYMDILVFSPADGAFWKWYSNGAIGADFSVYEAARYIGGAPGVVVAAQMFPTDYDGDGKTDILVFKHN